jgi:hypothetical protein
MSKRAVPWIIGSTVLNDWKSFGPVNIYRSGDLQVAGGGSPALCEVYVLCPQCSGWKWLEIFRPGKYLPVRRFAGGWGLFCGNRWGGGSFSLLYLAKKSPH